MKNEDTEIDFIEIKKEEKEYSENDLNEIVSVLPDAEKLHYGEEFQCYNVNNNEILTYIPIYNRDECVYIATCEKNGTLSVSNDSKFVDEIYKEFENDENVLLYINGNRFIAESENKRCLIEKYPITLKQNSRFNSLDLREKGAYIQDKIEVMSGDKIGRVNISNMNVYSDDVTVSSKSASVNTDLKLKKCNITNFVTQEYNNCWAASVATIVNYKKSMDLTAGDVSKAMGKSWYLWGTVVDARDALKHYGLSYTIKKGTPISWTKVKSDIDRKRPFSMGFVCSDNCHMVTGYGYAETKKNRYVAIWDSNGYQRLLTYNGSSSQITMNGQTYTWKDTVY